MPPEDNAVGAEPLTTEQLGLLKRWIEQGAHESQASTSESIDWQRVTGTALGLFLELRPLVLQRLKQGPAAAQG